MTLSTLSSCRAPRTGALVPLGLFTALLTLVAGPSPAPGQDADGGVPAAAEELRQGRFPWYDEEQDALRRVDVPDAEDDFAGRHSDWVGKRKKQGGGGGPPRATAFSQVLESLVWVLATLLLATLIGYLVWAFLNNANRPAASDESYGEKLVEPRIDRVEELPVPVQALKGDFLQQAEFHYANGNLRDAIICLFSYKLIQLDNCHAIHLERGKTNRQYLRELRRQPELRRLLEGTMVAFEDVFFGNHSLSREQFEACWRQVKPFQDAITKVQA